MADQRETKQVVGSDPQAVMSTALIERERLRRLLDASAEPQPAPRAHTIRRELLRAHAPSATRDELDTDIRPALSPILVAAVITLLVIVFIAATHAR